MPDPAALLVARSVRVRHDGSSRFTPDGVSFTVSPGEVVLVLGPSGCGKSTLALTLNGLVPQAVPAELEGTVEVGGTLTTEATVARLSGRVAMVFQDPDAQVVTGTLLDEVCFGPENLLLPVGEVLARAERALRQVGLWERRHDNPDRLSGGGRQRLAIACALALGSAVMVLDEPTANLDPQGIEEVYAVLAALVREQCQALVLIEHNLDAAVELVDRVLVLDAAGRLVAEGTPDEVLRDRADELAALGVWLPTATLAGLRLRARGHAVPRLPLSGSELTALLDTLPAPADGPGKPSASSGERPAVRVRGLRVSKGRSTILHDIDLDLPEGSFTAVVGTNGAGKTTLLQAIAGVVPPPRGAVEVRGVDPGRAGARELARTIGFVFQNPEHQFIRNSVSAELAHALELQGRDPVTIEQEVGRMLDRLGLRELREQHPFLLSGGQKRRLSVGTALMAGAPVLALDEPTFGQDRARAAELLALLGRLNASGTTVVVVTHDLQLVAEHASHTVVLHEGRVEAFGPTAEVLASGALERAGLLPPPLALATRAAADPAWRTVTRLGAL